jgi:hypothetical protein
MTLKIMTFSIMTLSIKDLNATLSINSLVVTLSIKGLFVTFRNSIKGLFVTRSLNDTQHNNTVALSVLIMTVTIYLLSC